MPKPKPKPDPMFSKDSESVLWDTIDSMTMQLEVMGTREKWEANVISKILNSITDISQYNQTQLADSGLSQRMIVLWNNVEEWGEMLQARSMDNVIYQTNMIAFIHALSAFKLDHQKNKNKDKDRNEETDTD